MGPDIREQECLLKLDSFQKGHSSQCLTQDSGQLFTYFVGETASSENMTFAQNVAGRQKSLPGTALPSQGPNPCPAARSGRRGSGSARVPVPAHRPGVEEGEGLLF